MRFFEFIGKVIKIAEYVATLTPAAADDKIISEAREVIAYVQVNFGKPVWKKDVDANQVQDKW